MSAYGDKQLQTIIEAYADAGRNQPAEYPALPAWQDLPIGMREAFISRVLGRPQKRPR